jgi:GT2 family glycosyltransferase
LDTPKLSICLPNLNAGSFLAERFATIFAQSFTDWELIVYDSYSDDGSWDLIQEYAASEPRMRIFQGPREGIYPAWNFCLNQARGEYVYIAPSDDTASPELLARLVQPLEASPTLDIAMSDYQLIGEFGEPIESPIDEEKRAFYGEWINVPSVRAGITEFLLAASFGGPMWVTITSILMRRSLLQRTGLFSAAFGSAGDYAWALKAYLHTDIAFVPGRLATWRIHPKQATQRVPSYVYTQQTLRCIESAFSPPAVPSQSTFTSHWREKATRRWRDRFAADFSLFRDAALQHPPAFARNLVLALRTNPALVFDYALRGFPPRVGSGDEGGATGAARALIEELAAPWPPTARNGVAVPQI